MPVVKYCVKCKFRCTKNIECGCLARKLSASQLIPMYHNNKQSAKHTLRAMIADGYKFAMPTVTEFINKSDCFTTPELEKRKEQSKKPIMMGSISKEDLEGASNHFRDDLPILIKSLPHYIKQKSNPVFPAPNEFIMSVGNIQRHKQRIERFLMVGLP